MNLDSCFPRNALSSLQKKFKKAQRKRIRRLRRLLAPAYLGDPALAGPLCAILHVVERISVDQSTRSLVAVH